MNSPRHTLLRTALLLAVGSAALTSLIATFADGVGAQDGQIEMKIATVAPEGTPWEKQLRSLKQHIESNSGGRIRVRMFMGGSLGGEKALVRRTSSGNVQCYGGSAAALASVVPELNVIESPYLFSTYAQADAALDGPGRPLVAAALARRGFEFGLWAENGFRSWFTRERPIHSPADLRGLRMRSTEARIHSATYEAYGATPNPIDVTNVLTSLQTGVVDGFDNTPLMAYATSWYQTVRHMVVSEHSYQPGIVVFSQSWLRGLPEDLRTMLTTLPGSITTDGRTQVRRMDPVLISNLQTRGNITVYRPNATELEAFARVGRPVQDRVAGQLGASSRTLLKALRGR